MATIYGVATRSDGSEIDGTVRVSTNWNSEKAFPRNGEYELDLGSNPKQRVTVYVNGDHYADIHVDGDTRLDIEI